MQVDGNVRPGHRPASPMLTETVGKLVGLHNRKPQPGVTTIHASPTGKIQILADAFRVTK